MDDQECPICGKESEGGNDTTNEWKYYCRPCNIRFKLVDASADGVFTLSSYDAGNDLMLIDDVTAAVILRT
jgi:hypothetical protein